MKQRNRFSNRGLTRRWNRRRGATAVEYLMILVMIVMPIGLMLPLFLGMARTYGDRITALIGLPFP